MQAQYLSRYQPVFDIIVFSLSLEVVLGLQEVQCVKVQLFVRNLIVTLPTLGGHS